VLNRTTSGTAHGLSKMVYWRDTRRAIGVDGYRLTHPPLRDVIGLTGVHFNDSVAIGDYNDDTHELRMPSCKYPQYMSGQNNAQGAKPYYIPLRALLVGGAGNLLATGKTMSQSFHANSNTRLHPSEWTSGVAAGGTAVLMIRNNWSSTTALQHVGHVQDFLNSSAVGSPRVWTLTGFEPSLPTGRVCMLGRCLSGPGSLAPPARRFNGTTCPASAPDCAPMAKDEWLANVDFWTRNATKIGEVIVATSKTVLKKSTAQSDMLPPSELLRVQVGFPCRLLAPKPWANYWLCKHSGSGSNWTEEAASV
jgi:hypothetical protein